MGRVGESGFKKLFSGFWGGSKRSTGGGGSSARRSQATPGHYGHVGERGKPEYSSLEGTDLSETNCLGRVASFLNSKKCDTLVIITGLGIAAIGGLLFFLNLYSVAHIPFIAAYVTMGSGGVVALLGSGGMSIHLIMLSLSCGKKDHENEGSLIEHEDSSSSVIED